MTIVFDTNIIARANPDSKGVARTLWLTILEWADHVLVLSPFLLRETERVLNYPRLQAIWPRGSTSSNTRRLSRISRS
jgi:predicted nucleic acid-binding protein